MNVEVEKNYSNIFRFAKRLNEKSEKKEKNTIFTFISKIISWTIFTLLLICAVLLLYYFIAMKIYAAKGEGYEPAFSLYTIISPSMTPNIAVYDVIVNFKVDKPEDVKINDVITFTSTSAESMGDTVTHRVVAISKDDKGNYLYSTKGDANLIEDSSQVQFGNIIGKVGLKIPQLGRIQFFIASWYGWMIVVLIPALYIVVKGILKVIILKNEDSKLNKIMSKPLLVGKKHKLLPEPKEEINDTESFINKIDNEDISISEIKNTTFNTSTVASNTSIDTNINKVEEETDEDDFDLPNLK